MKDASETSQVIIQQSPSERSNFQTGPCENKGSCLHVSVRKFEATMWACAEDNDTPPVHAKRCVGGVGSEGSYTMSITYFIVA